MSLSDKSLGKQRKYFIISEKYGHWHTEVLNQSCKSKYRQQKPNYDPRLLTTEIQSNHDSYSAEIKKKMHVILIH